MKPGTFDFKPLPTFSYKLAKIYLVFHNKKKSLMKSDTFDFKAFLFLLLHLYPLHPLIVVFICF